MSAAKAKPKPLSDRQAQFLAGLPEDGAFVHRGSAVHSTASALINRGLVVRRYDPNGSRFFYARSTPAEDRSVRPGMRFFSDQLHEVVRKHETLPGNWWCRGVEEDCGQWAYSETTILRNQRPNSPSPGTNNVTQAHQ